MLTRFVDTLVMDEVVEALRAASDTGTEPGGGMVISVCALISLGGSGSAAPNEYLSHVGISEVEDCLESSRIVEARAVDPERLLEPGKGELGSEA